MACFSLKINFHFEAKSMSKISILFIFQVIVFSAFAQQRLIATNEFKYSVLSELETVDSSNYIYNSSLGMLETNEPKFGFDGEFINWFYTQPLLFCDVEYTLFGDDNTPLDTVSYTLDAGLVVMQESTLNPTRFLYSYYSNGLMQSSEKQQLFSFNTEWMPQEKTEYEYDSSGNLTVEKLFFGDQLNLISADSLFYNAGGQLIKVSTFSFDYFTGQSTPFFEYIITYNGNEVSNLKVYLMINFPELKWDMNYLYSNGKPTQINGINEADGHIAQVNFYYGSNGKIIQVEGFQDQVLNKVVDFEYDENGFITKEMYSEQSSNPFETHVAREKYFYYETSNGIESADQLHVSVYPNPATNFVHVVTNAKLIGQAYSMFDAAGKLVGSGMVNRQRITIETGHLLQGMYFLTFGGIGQTVKIAIQ